MASSSELKNQRSKYYTLRDNVYALINKVNIAYSNLVSIDKIDDCFTIDNEPADGGIITTVKNNIGNIKDQLNNNVIPNINNKIDNLTSAIDTAIAREEAEERAEEERKEREKREKEKEQKKKSSSNRYSW